MIMSVMWNIFASLLFLVAIHRGAVIAVVAEPDGERLYNIAYLFVSNVYLLPGLLRWLTRPSLCL